MSRRPSPVLALRAETSGYNAALMRWWLVPHWSTGPQHKFSMFNARAETLASSPAYRDPFQVPALRRAGQWLFRMA